MENILDKINAYQEVLSTMPKNNNKNIEKYNSKIDEILSEYEKYQNSLLSEIKIRYNNAMNIGENENISRIKKEILNYKMILEIMDNTKTSYEKTNLDKEVYRLGKFYKENLEKVNYQIMTCINIFRNIGIEISEEDFCSCPFSKEYMSVFLQEMKIGDVNSDNVKKKFEEIYWKCPDIIVHIEVLINNIYLKYKKEIDKYYEQKKADTLKKFTINESDIINQYEESEKQLEKIISTDQKTIINKFLSGELHYADYEDDKINKIYSEIIDSEVLKKIQENDQNTIEEVNINICKFINSIKEYKYYLQYKFIFNSIKEKVAAKEDFKEKLKENLKEIDNLEKKLKKNGKPGLFSKKTVNTTEINQTFTQLKEKYRDVSQNAIFSRITETINENSTILQVFICASCFYKFLVDEIIKNIKDITQAEIDNFIEEFRNNIDSPYFTILNNIKMLEEKDIALIIKDRYKLLNFNIEKSDLDEENLDSLLDKLEKIQIKNNVDKSGLTIQKIKSICEYDKILKNN